MPLSCQNVIFGVHFNAAMQLIAGDSNNSDHKEMAAMQSQSNLSVATKKNVPKKSRGRVALLAVFAAALNLLSIPSWGTTLSFETSDPQSMWGTGAGAILDSSLFVGTTWDTPEAHLGGIVGDVVTTPSVPPILLTPAIPPQLITPAIPKKLLIPAKKICVFGHCVTTPAVYSPAIPAVYSPAIPAVYSPAIPGVTIDTRTGAKVDTSTQGTIGLQQSVKADAGSVDATVVFDANLQAPEQVQALNLFSLGGSSTLLGDSTFSTNFPQLSAKTELVIGSKANLDGQICGIGLGCSQTSTTIGFDPQTVELISFNENNNGSINILGLNNLGPSAFNFGDPIGITGPTGANLGDVTLYVPNLVTDGTVAGDSLTSGGSADFLSLKADLDGIAQTALGLPPILGTGIDIGILNFSYDLLNVEFGPTFDVVQTFDLQPTLMVDLAFSEPVYVEGSSSKVDFLSAPVADIPRIALDVNESVDVTPTYWVDASLHNTTQLGVDGEFVLQALQASVSLNGLGLTFDLGQLGPLFEYTNRFNIADFPPLFDKTFGLGGFSPIAGDTFSLTSAIADPQAGVPTLADAVAVLITGSPVELSQEVDKPSTDTFDFSFDYLFATDYGDLQVWLGDTLITDIMSSGVMDTFETFTKTLTTADYFGSLDTGLLRFVLDGSAGATLLLDNVVFPGIQNGDFNIGSLTGGLTGWQTLTSADGYAGVATFGVPEPGSLFLLLAGLGLLVLARLRTVSLQPVRLA
jgi:PEP-CTERM motif